MSKQLQQIKSCVRNDLQSVDQSILDQLQSPITLINEIGSHIIDSGGKRLRPLVLLLSANACGYTGKHHIDLAAAVEFLHTATLLHDDVVDASDRRRGKKTAHTLWGNATSVLVGDYIYTRAFQLIAKVKNSLATVTLADATNVIAQGEVMQLMHSHDIHIDTDRYLQVICFKTATLFQAASKIGALLATLDDEKVNAMAAFGLHIGNAFQLIDDALDYGGDKEKMGKNIGDDLAEGKITLPLIHTLKHCNDDEKHLIEHAISKDEIADIDGIVTAINHYDGLTYTQNLAQSEIDSALSALHTLPSSNYKEAMQALAEFVVKRDH